MPFKPREPGMGRGEREPEPASLEALHESVVAETGSGHPREALQQFLRRGWDKTILAKIRLAGSPFYEEPDAEAMHGRYQGRPIIGRDTPIHGGVYVGEGVREAIVVDEKHGELLKRYETFFRQRKDLLGSGERKSFKDRLLLDVYHFGLQELPYRKDIVQFIEDSFVKEGDEKIALDTYLNAGGGICRHQALFIGYLLERMKRDGLLRGDVSVDRNYVPMVGGHAWVRYKSSGDNLVIIDTALRYIGNLDDMDEQSWFYQRPGD